MSQSFTNLLYHLIFSTKDRQPLIKPDYEQRGYRAFTVSQAHVIEVQQCIAGQKEHDKRISFRDEFIQFLEANRSNSIRDFFDRLSPAPRALL